MNLKSRSWEARYTEDNKFFTGYPAGYHKLIAGDHRQDSVAVKPAKFGRGKSSAVFYFEDRDGHSYQMTCKGTSILLDMIAKDQLEVFDGYIHLDIVQVKQGANYAVEPVQEGE